LLLLHLIGITPLAVKVRQACRTPAFAFMHGTYTLADTDRPA
jgi:hypothetical protein